MPPSAVGRPMIRHSTTQGSVKALRHEHRLSHTFTKMGGDDIDLDIRPNQAHARRLVPVDAAEPRAEVALAQVRIRLRAFEGSVPRAQCPEAWSVLNEEKRRCQMEASHTRQVRRDEMPGTSAPYKERAPVDEIHHGSVPSGFPYQTLVKLFCSGPRA